MTGDSLAHRVLADGTRVEIRFIRPEDRDELARAFSELSPRARYQRFFAVRQELDEQALRFLTEVDGHDHVAVVAVTESHDMKREIGIGIARIIRLPGEPDVAEAAITVADASQGKGLGRILLQVLAELATARGIRTIRAEVLANNAAMRKLLADAGGVVRSDHGETVVLEVPLLPVPDVTEVHREHPLRRILRAAAETLASLHPPSDGPGRSGRNAGA